MTSSISGQASAVAEPKPAAAKATTAAVAGTPPRSTGADSSDDTKARKPRGRGKRRGNRAARAGATSGAARKRGRTSYPVVAFADVLPLAAGIMTHNQGEPTKRVTLLGKMGLPESALSTRNLITNSNKYGLTEGSYKAEEIKLTPQGLATVNPKANKHEQLKARFALAIGDVDEFNTVYEKRNGKNMPAPEMLHDDLVSLDQGDRKACADVFTSNVKFLGMLVPRDGAEYLMTVDEWLGQKAVPVSNGAGATATPSDDGVAVPADTAAVDFDKVCFVISTISEPGTDQRSHADVIMSQYVERALEGTGLKLERADKIGQPGMISKQIIEYTIKSKVVVADLSFHNPSVLYELALRHVTGKPTVHLIQESDKIPFDVGNFRTIKIDTGDKYKMVRELDTLRAEIATAIKNAITNGESRDNPILTYCPNAKFVMNGQP